MTEHKYTPGPWSIHKSSFDAKPFVVSPSDGKFPFIAMDIKIGQDTLLLGSFGMMTGKGDFGFPRVEFEEECRANARLAAAAPELLQCLITVLNFHELKMKKELVEACRFTIKKALEAPNDSK